MRVVIADFDAVHDRRRRCARFSAPMLMQERDVVVEAHRPWTAGSLPEGLRVVTKRPPTADEWEALRFAWRVCAHVKSNTVIFTERGARWRSAPVR